MIIDELQSEQERGLTTTSARLRWEGGEFRLAVAVPDEFAPGRPDASPFLCASVLLAMRLAEDLWVDGPLSPPLLERVPRVVDLYALWDPRLFRSRVRAREELEPAPRAAGIGCFMSRGVDSLYSAACPRGLPGPLTHLVFCDRLEPIHSAEVRDEEVRLATGAAERLGLPLVLIESNIRQLTDPIVRDWEDMVGAGLSFLATSMSGGLGHMVIPSSDGPMTVGACGTSPLLDPLFSTAEVGIDHDAPRTRTAKVAWLARQRADLLPYLKVCYHEDRADNCGRCSKCVVTMLALEAAGALGEASGFPEAVDPDVLAATKPPSDLNARLEIGEAERALRSGGAEGELVAAVRRLLDRADDLEPSSLHLPADSPAFRRRASRDALLLSRPSAVPPANARRGAAVLVRVARAVHRRVVVAARRYAARRAGAAAVHGGAGSPRAESNGAPDTVAQPAADARVSHSSSASASASRYL